jgi:hypothetical protein
VLFCDRRDAFAEMREMGLRGVLVYGQDNILFRERNARGRLLRDK